MNKEDKKQIIHDWVEHYEKIYSLFLKDWELRKGPKSEELFRKIALTKLLDYVTAHIQEYKITLGSKNE